MQACECWLQFHNEHGWRALDVCFLQLCDRLVVISKTRLDYRQVASE